MPIVAAKPLSGYPWFIRTSLLEARADVRPDPGAGPALGPLTMGVCRRGATYGALDRRSSPLSPALRSLVTVRVSQINHCAFCVDINSATLAKRGVSMEKINALVSRRESLLFNPEERLALEYAEAMTVTGDGVSNELRERLKNWWTDDGIVELTGLIAFQNLSSKFNAALDVPSQGFCMIPTRP